MKIDNINKRYIYFPVYVIVLVASIIGFYHYLIRPDSIEELPIEQVATSQVVDPAFVHCFEKNRSDMEGVLKLIPMDKLMHEFSNLNIDCFDQICSQLNDIADGTSSYNQLMSDVENDPCLGEVFQKALTYHNDVLSTETVIGLFFNEGAYALSASQRLKLKNILSIYRMKAHEYGLLVIGRASVNGGMESNKLLSLKRVESITAFTDALLNEEMQTDYVYFGSAQPQLDLDLSFRYHIDKEDYDQVTTSSTDDDFRIRLNQSVLVVIYDKANDPFQIPEN